MTAEVLTTDQMQWVLKRERARANRNGHSFSLLVFHWERDTADAEFAPLLNLLRQRLRTTDEIGWLPNARLGVMLMDTPAAGACRVAELIQEAFPRELAPPAFQVLAYPTQWSHTETDHSEHHEPPPARRLPVQRMEALFVKRMPFWKRMLDVLGAAVLLLVTLPVLLLAALAVKLTSRGPVLFRQRRNGLGGVPFTMYKLRTMVVDAERKKSELQALNEQDGPAFKIRRDPRVTPVGKLLRLLHLDELPQLWNVLRGEMSLVGPRPLPIDETQKCDRWHHQRLDVTPGITCFWQVRRDPFVKFADWVRMDMQYVRSRSLGQDVSLLWQTLTLVVVRAVRYVTKSSGAR